MSKFILSAFADEIDPNLEIQMDVLDEHGIKFIEMRGVNGKNLTQYSINEVKEIKKRLDERGFKLSSVGSPIGKIMITDDFGPHLNLFRHTIEIAKIMDVNYIRLFSFFIPQGENPQKYRDEVMDRIGRFVEAAKGTGITLLHENEKDIYGDTPERCLDIFRTINSENLRAVFDPANFVQCDVPSNVEAFEMLRDYVVYLHIKDALFSDHSVVPAGYGDGQVKEILSLLRDRGFEGFLSLEPHLSNFAGFADLEPNAKTDSMAEGGPKYFVIAVDALRKILNEIGADAQ